MIERFISIFAVAQAIYTTLYAGANLLEEYLINDSSTATFNEEIQIDGPRILPPNSTKNETSPLHDLTLCVRESIKLGIRDYYQKIYNETIEYTIEKLAKDDEDDETAMSYSLTPQPFLKAETKPRITITEETHGYCSEAGSDEDQADSGYHAPAPVVARILNCLQRVSVPSLLLLRPPQSNDHTNDDFHEDDEDFLDFEDVRVTNHSLSNTTAATIRTFAPRAFASLRRSFGITTPTFQRILLASGPYVSFQANSKGSAAKGVFFFSPNGAFLIKSIKKAEKTSLLSILPRYTSYMRQQKGRSLLSQICGMYEVLIPGGQEYCFIVMNSVFPADAAITERFDLKGSTVGRKAAADEKVMKDLDLVEQSPLDLGSTLAKKKLIAQLQRDVQLLEACSLIDYSLLVGVSQSSNSTPVLESPPHDPLPKRFLRVLLKLLRLVCYKPHKETSKRLPLLSTIHGLRSNRPASYYLGVIDFLQPYSYKKMVEYQLKSLIHEKNSFSCVPPSIYSKRFLSFLDKHVI